MLQDKTIVLGITGGIAAYKAADLASKLTQAGATVEGIMTESATRFVTPLTFRSLTGRPFIGAPAMHSGMFQNSVTQDNLAKLKARGFTVVGPIHGRLASGKIGW